MFKVGDYFISVDMNTFEHRTFGKVYKIVEIKGERGFYLCDYGNKRSFNMKDPECVGAKKVLLNNSLNKKLYPDRVPVKIKVVRDDPDRVVWQNYLVPREVAEKLKEQDV